MGKGWVMPWGERIAQRSVDTEVTEGLGHVHLSSRRSPALRRCTRLAIAPPRSPGPTQSARRRRGVAGPGRRSGPGRHGWSAVRPSRQGLAWAAPGVGIPGVDVRSVGTRRAPRARGAGSLPDGASCRPVPTAIAAAVPRLASSGPPARCIGRTRRAPGEGATVTAGGERARSGGRGELVRTGPAAVAHAAGLVERYLAHVHEHEPVEATRLGLDDRDGDLPDLAPGALGAPQPRPGDAGDGGRSGPRCHPAGRPGQRPRGPGRPRAPGRARRLPALPARRAAPLPPRPPRRVADRRRRDPRAAASHRRRRGRAVPASRGRGPACAPDPGAARAGRLAVDRLARAPPPARSAAHPGL
jgi:hypothetical protein